MGRYLIERSFALLLTLLFVSIVSFFLLRFVPGDPIDAMYGADRPDPAVRAALLKKLGLDQPIWIQYGKWLRRVAAGDLGYSIWAHMPVSQLMLQRLPATLILSATSLGVAIAIAIPMGILAATRRETVVDLAGMATALLAISVPPFVSGTLLVGLFGVKLGWLPTMGYPGARVGVSAWAVHLALPTLTLAGILLGVILRLTRSTVLEELVKDYARTARAKGLIEGVVLLRHVLRNALLPVVTLIGLQLSFLLGGAVVVETIFAWPGIGSLVVSAILARDYPVVQAVVLLIASLVVVVSLLVDFSYAVLDPRVRVG